MFCSRALFVVFKTTGGKAWNPPTGLRPLTETQKRNRRKNIEQTLKNNSVLKMAAAQQPEVPTRLYKPLPNFQLLWMRKKLDKAREIIAWREGNSASPASSVHGLGMSLPGQRASTLLRQPQQALSSKPQLPYAMRVKSLADQLAGRLSSGSSRSSSSSR
ncbi:hypothetical protein DUNSADRAFT_14666 [Dunaliella salina]|uniref:Encoded protein n=1 Tax=Dunaliella salina TaxID=3046 RepID=A0ABQ7G721_DUNSA|nr:hypothetical protein DUNSADRAFT_14666 [Dunaliella salina]|eukprot:KAF5830384.1 hypothetical protein DUNSADRAFT_14666 [Dunaliella salina]